MRFSPAALLLALLLPLPAHADRVTVGVAVGHDGGAAGVAPGDTHGVFAEVRVLPRIALAAEIGRQTADGGPTLRHIGGALIVDLARGHRVTPYALVAVGDERTSDWLPSHFRTRELGAGLSLSLAHGLFVRLEARVGDRKALDPVVTLDGAAQVRLFAPVDTYDRDRSVRVGVGIRF